MPRIERANGIVERLTKSTKRIYLLSRFLSIAFIELIFFVLLDGLISLVMIVSVIVIFSMISTIVILKRKQYENITQPNILEHINRRIPAYQESSQIILDKDNSSAIKSILKENVMKRLLIDDESGLLKNTLPPFQWKLPLFFLVILLFSSCFAKDLKSLTIGYFSNSDKIVQLNKETSDSVEKQTGEKQIVEVQQVTVDISPPKYTKAESTTGSELNFRVIEGSDIIWSIKFNTKVSNAYILFTTAENRSNSQIGNQSSIPSNQKVRMEYDSKSQAFVFRKKIFSTQIYRIEVRKNNTIKKPILIDGVFSITVIKDLSPKIKIVNPKGSLTEYSRNVVPLFVLEANISDDYGVSKVVIQASVAKGSGEAVKFRDKVFEFDRVENISTKRKRASYRYIKNWSLNDLDMQPGDEVYFHIVASDNHMPENQSTRSSSIIVRWSDDEDIEIAAEGLRIGFVPEYFRSQRQIIIETIELIEDRGDVDISVFKERSVDLGHSQSDIKEKYGQYLGDEFGEGEGASEVFGSSGGSSENEPNTDEEEHAHEFEEEENEYNSSNKQGNASALIAEFTHNHSSIEIAPLSKRDPKTWMKMAVKEMWQAELHLMLSEPIKALPFEQKAYKYLKLARKADRIYAKRLGFEPPPVTEERRLTGELNEVKSSLVDTQGFSDTRAKQQLYHSSYALINRWLMLDSVVRLDFELQESHHEVLNDLKEDLLEQAKMRPVLIKYVAILEQITLINSFQLTRCDSCIVDLQSRLWRFISNSKSLAKTKSESIGISKEDEKSYLDNFNGLIESLDNKVKEKDND